MSRFVDLDGFTWDGTKITSKIQEVHTKCGYFQGITIGWLWGDKVPHIDMEEHDKMVRADERERMLSIVSRCVEHNIYKESEGMALLNEIEEELKENCEL